MRRTRLRPPDEAVFVSRGFNFPVAHRIARASVTIQKELGELISSRLNDPRLPDMVSVTHVDLATDLTTARVFVSTPGGREERDLAIEALESAAGHLSRELESRMKIRRTPRLVFVADDLIERAEGMSGKIDKVLAEDRKLRRNKESV